MPDGRPGCFHRTPPPRTGCQSTRQVSGEVVVLERVLTGAVDAEEHAAPCVLLERATAVLAEHAPRRRRRRRRPPPRE
ncbi:hypothetical protein AB0469_14875 [Streptomyces sp. NPDC093801]|uniref:hypothetical protein n=1 Tax=Streptomyces sp. NPDC093801 TaxID=3155203 RepID=UPI00344E91D4